MTKLTVACPDCGVDVTAEVYEDLEGDAGVIGGLHRFVQVEDIEHAGTNCEVREARLVEIFVDAYGDYDDGPDPDLAYDMEREARLEDW